MNEKLESLMQQALAAITEIRINERFTRNESLVALATIGSAVEAAKEEIWESVSGPEA